LLLVACGAETPAERGKPSAASLEPADAELAAIYNRSCRSCHAQGAAKAPLTGDVEAWSTRMDQGMEVMLDHAIIGYGGMPPMGMCFDCSETDFIALIEFMSQG
jgi:cytochrome c5